MAPDPYAPPPVEPKPNAEAQGPGGQSSGAAGGPSRNLVTQSVVPIRTGGLYPRQYRHHLRDQLDTPFVAMSEYDSTTVHYDGSTPIIGTALHYNGRIRRDMWPKLALDRPSRYYEEDPETHKFLGSLMHTLTPNQSRFELDLNRPPDTTIYTKPSLAWGLETWKEPMTQYEREFTLEKWYEFQTMIDAAVEHAVEQFGYAIIFDFHSYNYQRKEYVDWRTDGKPVINLGTRHLSLDARGTEIKDWFFDRLRQHTVLGEECLVEENGVFYGGYLNRRLSHLYQHRCITLSVEYKKVYMDERTGIVDEAILGDLVSQMDETIRELGGYLGVPVHDKPQLHDLIEEDEDDPVPRQVI